ncbi:unnamed protein product [Tilletia caries]|nr:unnamed protein product [Tilletia caries]
MRDATLVQDDVDHRKFKPDKESLETYLSDKYKLVSELQVAKAMAAGHTDFDNPNPEAARILMTVTDAIQTVHNGLPADWRTLLNARKTREEVTLASVKIDTAIHDNGWKPAPQSIRTYGQPTPASSDSSVRKKDREEHLCYHCHEAGHFKYECPRREEDIKHVRAILATMEDTDHRNIDSHVVKKVRMTTDQPSRPGAPVATAWLSPTVHNGLPADWRTLLNVYRQEDDWSAYRSQLLGNERQTREAIAVFSGNAHARKTREEETPASVKIDTAIHGNGWKSATPSIRTYGQPTPATSDSSVRKKDREEHLCYHCHEAGHFKYECPRREEDIKHVRAILATMEDTDHRNIDSHVVKKVRMTTDQPSRPGSSGGDDLVRVAQGTHITRDDIDEPARVVYARKAYVSSDVDNSPPLSPIHWKYGGPTITASYTASYESDSDSD